MIFVLPKCDIWWANVNDLEPHFAIAGSSAVVFTFILSAQIMSNQVTA
jgi:hypothetical protein